MEIVLGVPQDATFGSLLLLLIFVTIIDDIEIVSQANDNTPYVSNKDRRSYTTFRKGLKNLV